MPRMREAVLVMFVAGCAMTGSYLGARTPPKGTTHVGLIFRAAAGRNAVPFPLVDGTVSYSPSDAVSLHLRGTLVAPGAEALVRWRMVHAGRFYLALAPAVAASYWQASRGVEEDASWVKLGPGANVLARLNVLASLDLGAVDLDLAAFGGISRIVESAVPAADDAPYAFFDYEMQGVVAIGGGALGLTIPAKDGSFHPAIEWMRFAERELAAGAGAAAFRPQNVWTFTLAWEH